MSPKTRPKPAPLSDFLAEKDLRFRDLTPAERARCEVLSLTVRGLVPQAQRFKHRIATEDISTYKVVRRGWIACNPYVMWEGAVQALRDRDIGVVSPAYPVYAPLENDNGYLDFALRSPEMLSVYSMLATGAVNRRRVVSRPDFLGIHIAAPDIRERRNIGDSLTQIDDAVAIQNKAVAILREMKESALSQVFRSGAKWSAARLCEAADFYRGVSWRAAEANKDGIGVPVLAIRNIGDGALSLRAEHFLTKKIAEEKILRQGDILFVGSSGSAKNVGRNAHFAGADGEKYTFASFTFMARVNSKEIDPLFFYYAVNSPMVDFSRHTVKAADGKYNFHLAEFKEEAKIKFPPLAEQRRIAAMFAVIDDKIRLADEKRILLEEMLKSALQTLMGKVTKNG